MKRRNYGLYAIAVAIAVVGALWLGVPLQTLALLGVVLICPLMMLVMMREMHGDQHRTHPYERSEDPRDRPSTR